MFLDWGRDPGDHRLIGGRFISKQGGAYTRYEYDGHMVLCVELLGGYVVMLLRDR